MNATPRWAKIAAVLGVLVLGAIAHFHRVQSNGPTGTPGAGEAPADGKVATPPADAMRASGAAAADGPRVSADGAAPLDLSSPVRAVVSAVRVLAAGDDDAFRATLLPAVRAEASGDAIRRCRERLRLLVLMPDWEVAEKSLVDGHAVVRVSMFGKGMTAFHAIDGRWLADRLWCLPPGP